MGLHRDFDLQPLTDPHDPDDWRPNSIWTLVAEEAADVAVIVEEIGHITWGTEVTAELLAGKPFLVLCQQSTYERYLVLNAEFRPPASLDSLEEAYDVEAVSSPSGVTHLTFTRTVVRREGRM